MFKNRDITVKVSKKHQEDQIPTEPVDPHEFERKTEYALHKLTNLGVKVFAGVCVYVLLDTYRQVEVAKATRPTD